VTRRRALLILLTALAAAATPAPATAQTMINTDVAAGRWKTLRLRNIPAGAELAIEVRLEGTIEVALVRGAASARSPETGRPLFRAPVERRLSFSVTAPADDDYYVVLDNRKGRRAACGGAEGPGAAAR